MLQIRMLTVEASGSSVFFLPLLWWHATPKEVWKRHRLFWSVTVTTSEKLSLVATDYGEKVWALTWCLPYKAKPTGKKKKKADKVLLTLTSAVISTVVDDCDTQSHVCVMHGYGKMDCSSAVSCQWNFWVIDCHWFAAGQKKKKDRGLVRTTAIVCYE